MDVIWAAAIAGLVGSLHCAAMCGPLALAASSRGNRVRATAAYLGGRFVSYVALGALFGALGQHALCKLPVAQAQWIAVIVVAGASAWRGISLLVPRRPERLVRLQPKPPRRSLLAMVPRRAGALGLVTGILPCGMLVPAWMLAAASARPDTGALVMLAFAAASTPGLLLPVIGRGALARLSARLPARAPGIAWCALSLWILARPLLASVHHHH